MTRELQYKGANCANCAFWSRQNNQDGSCRLRAPNPVNNPNEVAHWPRTHEADYCGEWGAKDNTAPALVACGECVYWRHPIDGLHPTQRGDQTSEWWSSAGHCLRFSPRPCTEPGFRAFWPATHSRDACSNGKTRSL
jgi:hypothetical protein